MSPNWTAALRTFGAASILLLAAGMLAACDIDSVDSTSAVLSDNSGTFYNYAGLYMHPQNDSSTNGLVPLVFPYEGSSRPSGQLITSLRLLQYGSVLEAYDSANQVWSGRISALQGGTATFSLSGRTTAGQTVELAGTLVYADSSSTMDASWIEPSYYGTLSAQATVSPATTNSPSPTNDWDSVSMEPGGTVNLNTNSTTQVFTADGGSGSYNWTLSTTSFGRLDVYSGESVTYTANGTTGTAVLRVYDTSDNSNDDSTTILFQ